MSLVLDMRRALRSNSKRIKTKDPLRSKQYTDNDLKARHILGLETTYIDRKKSSSSASTHKARGVTFSDATTAAVSSSSVTEDSCDERSSSDLVRKESSVLHMGTSKERLKEDNLKTQTSRSSLQSFYDKTVAPLSVSQQTSDSSSRDFALRRGAPSILSSSGQEMEHSKQLRLFSRPSKKSRHEKDRPTPLTTKSSRNSIISSVVDIVSEAGLAERPQRPRSRISITRTWSREITKSPAPTKHASETEHPYPMVKAVVDPSQAKINVRRPKVGTRNWFDDLDSDSSDGEDKMSEPQLQTDFAVEVAAACDEGRIDQLPPRTSSRNSTSHRSLTPKPLKKHSDVENKLQHFVELASKLESRKGANKSRANPFETADLTQQSILCLSSSGEESDDDLPITPRERSSRTEIRESLISVPWDESEIEFGQALTVDTRESDRLIQQLEAQSDQIYNLPKPPLPQRSSSRQITYLEDKSTDTLTQAQQHNDCSTSFCFTPTETLSGTESIRQSILSEDESVVSTKLMTVTRQEENLIAAMRLKKIAMRRAQEAAERQGALRVLELDSSYNSRSQLTGPRRVGSAPKKRNTKNSFAPIPRSSSLSGNFSSRDSITTFQTDSIHERSVRSSIATYLSEGSEDLHLPYSSIDGLPMGSSVLVPERTMISNVLRPERQSSVTNQNLTAASTSTASTAECSPSVRDSQIVVLDPLERQLLRDEIPSQLFMERPFLGWEARANMQAAH